MLSRNEVVSKIVDKFLAWPLPESVCSDLCATKQGYPHRSGTTLLSAVEAKQMIEYLFTEYDAALQAKVEELEKNNHSMHLRINAFCVLETKLQGQLDTVTKERDEAQHRIRTCTQRIIEEIGAEGPENLEFSLQKLLHQLLARDARIKKLETALQYISEYWNGNENQRAMADACNMARDTAQAALGDGGTIDA